MWLHGEAEVLRGGEAEEQRLLKESLDRLIGAELDNRSMFFLFERPVRRWQVLLFKYAVGAVQTTTCVGLSILSTLTIVYFIMAASATNVTLSGSRGAFLSVVSNGVRGTVWTMVIGLMVYSATFLFSVWFEKWWIAVIAGAVSLVLMFYYFGSNLSDDDKNALIEFLKTF